MSPRRLQAQGPQAVLGEPDLDDLMERFRGPLIGLLKAWRAAEPVELAQDVFAEAWISRGRFAGDWGASDQVGPWLRGIAWNLCAAAGRRRERGGAPLESAPEPAAPAEPADDSSTHLRAAIDRLPGELRAAVLMHYLERTPVREVAALLSVTEKTIEGRLYRARRELARLLEADAAKEATR
ncbi:RNA polymerase sigma factor [Engelhardtia mirabilis]|uniref:ECF RNA polymerase sigma factor SigE n=1 Tax=Engelhardtia mirabilis TaxID=2528011 RepID=A0A518BG99_9BACT|nr:ECF RNA polymerase sigma factor SigE [Planctomycetes bacterium Pla133]QDV00320.1 ECF RNA polymerase sigma factor SigE [Planctomycetes bacterium Pla86]